MNAKDVFKGIFCLVIRLIGLMFLYQALQTLPIAIVPLYTVPFRLACQDFITRLLMMAWELAVAYWMMRGAPPLLRLAYPDSESRVPDAAPGP